MSDEARHANYVRATPERYVPGLMQGELVEAEHLARYHWAAGLGCRGRVLDAGCGMAYGTQLLAGAGATQVIGVDVASAVLESVRPQMPDTVELTVADIRSLPFPDDHFQAVVCFEVIEHVADPEPVLAELIRVLDRDGVLLVSSPNRLVYPSGNPHHMHEFTPEELLCALRRQLANVRMARQHSWTASLLTGAEPLGDEPGRLEPCRTLRTADVSLEQAAYSVAIASDAELPDPDDVVTLGGGLEIKQWIELFDRQRDYINDLDFRLQQAESAAEERGEIRRQLVSAEQELAEATERDGVRRELEAELERVTAESERAQGVVSDMKDSVSWRLTAPLRAGKRLARGRG